MKNITEFPFGPKGRKRSLQLELMKVCWRKEQCHGLGVISLEHKSCAESEQPVHTHLNCPEPPPSPIFLHPFHVGEKHRKKKTHKTLKKES